MLNYHIYYQLLLFFKWNLLIKKNHIKSHIYVRYSHTMLNFRILGYWSGHHQNDKASSRSSSYNITTEISINIWSYINVLIKFYYEIFITFQILKSFWLHSSNLHTWGFDFFSKSLHVAYIILGLVPIARYKRQPTTWIHMVLSNLFFLNSLFSICIILKTLLYCSISNLSKIPFKYCNRCII